MARDRRSSNGDGVSRNAPAQSQHRGGRAVFRYPSFVRYLGARLLTVLALQMQSVAVGWQIYEITRSPLALGLTRSEERRVGKGGRSRGAAGDEKRTQSRKRCSRERSG